MEKPTCFIKFFFALIKKIRLNYSYRIINHYFIFFTKLLIENIIFVNRKYNNKFIISLCILYSNDLIVKYDFS